MAKGKMIPLKLRLGRDHLAFIEALSLMSGEKPQTVFRVLLALGMMRVNQTLREMAAKKNPPKRG